MTLLELSTLLVVLTAALAFLNAHFLRLPASIGVTVGGLIVSLLFVLASLKVPFAVQMVELARAFQFQEFVFQGVLSFLLFAGGLGVSSTALWQRRGPVLTFALISAAPLYRAGWWGALGLAELFRHPRITRVPPAVRGDDFADCPGRRPGDARQAKVPERTETVVAGERLFNGGVWVVAFTFLASLVAATGNHGAGHAVGLSFGGVLGYFAQEALGGLLLGSGLGLLGYLALRAIDDFTTEVLVTLGVVLLCTMVALSLHVSAPLAAVAAGLLIGSLTDRRPC